MTEVRVPTVHTVTRALTEGQLRAARAVVLRVAESDLGYGYRPEWHWDLDRMVETYVDNPRQALFVATAAEGEVVGTAAVRIGGPLSPPHPAWLADRYADRAAVAQLLRLAVLPHHRRNGLASRLVEACREFVRSDGGFRSLCLHTNTRVPGAEAFWRSRGCVEVCDARGTAEDTDPRFATVHFELPLREPSSH